MSKAFTNDKSIPLGQMFRAAVQAQQAQQDAARAAALPGIVSAANRQLEQALRLLPHTIASAVDTAQKGGKPDAQIQIITSSFQLTAEEVNALDGVKAARDFCRENNIAFKLSTSQISGNPRHTMLTLTTDLSQPFTQPQQPRRGHGIRDMTE